MEEERIIKPMSSYFLTRRYNQSPGSCGGRAGKVEAEGLDLKQQRCVARLSRRHHRRFANVCSRCLSASAGVRPERQRAVRFPTRLRPSRKKSRLQNRNRLPIPRTLRLSPRRLRMNPPPSSRRRKMTMPFRKPFPAMPPRLLPMAAGSTKPSCSKRQSLPGSGFPRRRQGGLR